MEGVGSTNLSAGSNTTSHSKGKGKGKAKEDGTSTKVVLYNIASGDSGTQQDSRSRHARQALVVEDGESESVNYQTVVRIPPHAVEMEEQQRRIRELESELAQARAESERRRLELEMMKDYANTSDEDFEEIKLNYQLD